MEFEGCIYDTPCKSPEEFEWQVDAVTGKRYTNDLTCQQLSTMPLVGLPVRIEHQDRKEHKSIYNNEVGTVTEAHIDPKSGRTTVRYTLHDNPAGFTAKTLTNTGTIRDLSLHHRFYPDTGVVQPVEISLCTQGARKGTHIYKDPRKCGLNKEQNSTSNPVAIPVTMSEPVKEKDAPADAPVVDVTEEVAQQNTLGEQPAPAEPDSDAPAQATSNQDFLEVVSKHVKDPAVLNELYSRFGNLMKYGCDQGEIAKELKIKLSALEEANKKITENNAQTAEQMIAVMNDLYRRFSPDCVQNEDCLKEASKELGENPNLMNMLRGMPVMASAISLSTSRNTTAAQEHETATIAMQKDLQNSKATVAMYEKQIGSMQGFTSDPLWEPAAKPVSVVEQSPAVAVVCSAGNKRQRSSSLVPNWLRAQCGEYQEANYNQQKVFDNDFDVSVRPYGQR